MTWPCPDAYVHHSAAWSDLVDNVWTQTHDIPEDVSDRMSRYVAALTERYGRAPRFDAITRTFSTEDVDKESEAAA